MTPEQPTRISVIDPLSPTFDSVKTVLFKPFELKKWFIIGFCAWLAYLGEKGGGGGGGPNFQRGGDPAQAVHQAKDFFLENLAWIIPVAAIVVMVIILLWLVLTWLSSRGRFMFLHCVAENKAEVKLPWRKFRQHSNSLFLFRIVVGLIALVVIGLPFIIIALLIATIASGRVPYFGPVGGLVVTGIAIAVIIFAFWLVDRFTTDFVVPIMFLRTTSCVAAWRELLTLLSANKGCFVLYVLFRILIAIAIIAIILAAVFVTCCCAACILAIPYIGTVALLPVLVFKRAYSLCYFRQYGPKFDVFSPAT